MSNLRFFTSGESHGKALTGILEGIPSGLSVSSDAIDIDLKRRQGGYGRGGRMKIEADHAEILSGVRMGKTIGSPITILIENKDWVNWQDIMNVECGMQSAELPPLSPPLARGGSRGGEKGGEGGFVTRPRPGHADLAGAIKYDTHDIRDILERSSARETAMRVALGAIAKKFLEEFGIKIGSYAIQIGPQQSAISNQNKDEEKLLAIFKNAEKSPVRCPDKNASKKMVSLIDKASKEGNSLGGIFEVFAVGIPIGLGSHIQWDKRLDARLAQGLMSIQAIKGVEVGMGFEMSRRFGSEVMDEIFYSQKSEVRSQKLNPPIPPLVKGGKGGFVGFYRKTNYAGGIEGGMTNGMPIILRAAMKPIPTLRRALRSIDIITKKPFKAVYERSDICAVPAAGVVGEAMTALIIADAFLEKFGGDNMTEIQRNYNSHIKYLSNF